jgi:RNA polymerase-binding transcription factor DksA
MASKKKQTPKKVAKPAPKAASKKQAVKKTVKKSTPVKASKPAPKKTAKPVVKVVAAKKPVAKPLPPKQPVKPVAAAPVKPVAKPVEKPVVLPKKLAANDPKSLVSIKQTVKPVIKKEPPRPTKMVIPRTTIKSSVKYEPEFTKSVLDSNPMYDYSGPTMRYSDSDLTEFREIIQKKLDAAKKELAYLQGLITRRDEGGDMDEARYMTMEDGSVSMEREQLSQMASRQITFIDHLEKAMMRIENKTYGICRVTGKLIDKARLRAVPHATLSIEAKQMMNK